MGPGRVRGQSEPLGVGLILAITILGALTAAVFGAAALSDTERSAEFEQAQQALTQFDSTASQVALGNTSVQSVAFGASGGTYRVEPGAGHVRIIHYDYDGAGNDHVIHEADLGAVIYDQGDRSVAYQGGGVWTSSDGGSGTVVSPPEFHYRGATLTFPIVQVQGSDAVSGSATATVHRTAPTDVVYPSGGPYPDGSPYENPQEKGKVEVEIESLYYEAWAEYFRERTDGTVTTTAPATPGDPGTVTVELVSLGIGPGHFDMPGEGGAIELRGLGTDHAINDFEITIRPTDEDSANFNNLQWSLYAESSNGEKQLEIHLRQNDGGDCSSITADAIIYYTDDGGDTYQGWVEPKAFQGECNADDEVKLVADFTGSGNSMTYQSLGSDDLLSNTPAKPNGDLIDPVTIEAHGHGDRSYDSSTPSTEDMDFLVRHYIANFGSSIDLEVYDKNGNGGSVSEGQSEGEVQYGGSGQYVTFLHVTENGIEVEFN